MALGDEFGIFGSEWARIHFTENEGMAFGMVLGGENGKLFLTLFRMVAVSFIGYYLYTLIRHKASMGLIASIAFIFAGAMGNIIDSVFYGVIFNDSIYQVARLFPPKEVMPVCFTERWWICFTSRSSKAIIPNGCPG